MPGSRYRLNSPRVISEVIDGEAVIINLETGTYYSVVGAGAEVWALLERGRSTNQISEHLEQRYDTTGADVLADLDRFVADLLGEHLLVPRDAGDQGDPAVEAEPATTTTPAARPAFRPPVLERFTDMQDLILLDPVHDVEADVGWPSARPPGPGEA